MSDNGQRPGDEPEYDWLYGQRPAGPGSSGRSPQPPPSDDPEPTQMLPAMQRPRATEPPPSPARGRSHHPPPRLPSEQARDKAREQARRADARTGPPAARPVSPAKQGRGRARTVRRLLLSVLALWVVFLVAVPFWAWNRIDKVPYEPSAERPADQPGTTYLLVGSDSREGLSAEQRKKLGTGDAGGKRTDTIMLLHTGSGPNLLISIPRDSIVPIPGHGTTKINAAYAFGGPELLVQTIEQNTGVRVDGYVEIGMGGVVNAVDAVGGVRICNKTKLVDKLANLNLPAGCHPKVDGAVALAYTRTRHTQQLGDIDRAKNQRAIVSQVGNKVRSPMTVINPVRYLSVAKAGSTALTVGDGMSLLSVMRFAWAMSHLDGDSGKTCSMPIRDLAVHWDRDRALALMKLVKEDNTSSIPASLCSPSGLAGQ